MDLREIESKVSELCWSYTPEERKAQLLEELRQVGVRVNQGASGTSWSIVPYGEHQALLSEAPEFSDLSQGVKSLLTAQRKSGHGHVWDRPDGVKSRCGGPNVCHVCAHDKAWLDTLSDSEKRFFLR